MNIIQVSMGMGAAIGTLAGFTALSPLVMSGIAAAIFTSALLYGLYGYHYSNRSISNPEAALLALSTGFALGIGLAAAATAILPSESLAGALIAGAIVPLGVIVIDAIEHFSSRRQEV